MIKRQKKGFTLVELLVVIGIIGILAAMILPKFTGYVDKAKEKEALSNARTIYTEMMAYYAEHGKYMDCGYFTGEGVGEEDGKSQFLHDIGLKGFVCYQGHVTGEEGDEEGKCNKKCTPGTFKYDNKDSIDVIFDGTTFKVSKQK